MHKNPFTKTLFNFIQQLSSHLSIPHLQGHDLLDVCLLCIKGNTSTSALLIVLSRPKHRISLQETEHVTGYGLPAPYLDWYLGVLPRECARHLLSHQPIGSGRHGVPCYFTI